MYMKNYPKEFYAKETKTIHKVGYTLALMLMAVGVAETIHSVPYILKGESDMTSMTLGPIGVAAGGVVAYSYLKEANVL
jgi:hypothetical protein